MEHSEETGRVAVGGGGGGDRHEVKDEEEDEEEDGGVLPEIPSTTEKWKPGFPPRERENNREQRPCANDSWISENRNDLPAQPKKLIDNRGNKNEMKQK